MKFQWVKLPLYAWIIILTKSFVACNKYLTLLINYTPTHSMATVCQPAMDAYGHCWYQMVETGVMILNNLPRTQQRNWKIIMNSPPSISPSCSTWSACAFCPHITIIHLHSIFILKYKIIKILINIIYFIIIRCALCLRISW